eukprot:1161776-Pelagomonas_calceolata.AAC.4
MESVRHGVKKGTDAQGGSKNKRVQGGVRCVRVCVVHQYHLLSEVPAFTSNSNDGQHSMRQNPSTSTKKERFCEPGSGTAIEARTQDMDKTKGARGPRRCPRRRKDWGQQGAVL